MDLAKVESGIAAALLEILPGEPTVLRGIESGEIPPFRQIVIVEAGESTHEAGPLHTVPVTVRVESPVMQFTVEDQELLFGEVKAALSAQLPALTVGLALQDLLMHGLWIQGNAPYREDGSMGVEILCRFAIEEDLGPNCVPEGALAEIVAWRFDQELEAFGDQYIVDARTRARVVTYPEGEQWRSTLFGGLEPAGNYGLNAYPDPLEITAGVWLAAVLTETRAKIRVA